MAKKAEPQVAPAPKTYEEALKTVDLTDAELAEFTPLNCAAFDLIRKESKEKGVTPCMWLCMSDDAKQKARDAVVAHIGKALGIIAPCEQGIKNLIKGQDFTAQLRQWKFAELDMKRHRATGNPKAYFVPAG